MYKNVAVASIEMGNGWDILYNKLHGNGQPGVFDNNDPVESVHVEFSSEKAVEVVICLSAKEKEEIEDIFGPLDVNGPSSVKPTVIF